MDIDISYLWLQQMDSIYVRSDLMNCLRQACHCRKMSRSGSPSPGLCTNCLGAQWRNISATMITIHASAPASWLSVILLAWPRLRPQLWVAECRFVFKSKLCSNKVWLLSSQSINYCNTSCIIYLLLPSTMQCRRCNIASASFTCACRSVRTPEHPLQQACRCYECVVTPTDCASAGSAPIHRQCQGSQSGGRSKKACIS